MKGRNFIRYFVAGGFIFLVFACQNFEYSHNLCTTDQGVDIPQLVGGFYQIENGAQNNAFGGVREVSGKNFKIEKTENVAGKYKLTEEGGTPRELTVCRIGSRTIVENLDMSAGGTSNKRAVFQLEPMNDGGFLFSALQVDLEELKASGIPYQLVDSDTVKYDPKTQTVNVEPKTEEKIAKEKRDKTLISISLLLNTEDPKDKLKLEKLMIVDSDAKRVFKGTYKNK